MSILTRRSFVRASVATVAMHLGQVVPAVASRSTACVSALLDNTGLSDATEVLQAAVTSAAGGCLMLPGGNIRTSSAITVPSGTRITGAGAATRMFTTAQHGFSFFQNENLTKLGCNGSYDAPLDQSIIIDNISFDYGALDDGGTHTISFRLAQDCLVEACSFRGGNDGTSFLACSRMRVDKCLFVGCSNVAIDNWDGCTDILAENNIVTMAPASTVGSNTGIMFSASATNPDSASRLTQGCIARGNRIYNAGVAVFVNQLDSVSSTYECIIENNEAIDCLGGYYFTGSGGGHLISGNKVAGGGGPLIGGAFIRIAGETAARAPNDCQVTNNSANGFVAGSVNTGFISASGDGHIFKSLTLTNGSGINGTVYYISSPVSLCSILNSQSMDDASVRAITYGLFQGNTASTSDTNALINCWDGWLGIWRRQGCDVN